MAGVIVLMIILVIVPTVCLVWFMGAALEHSESALRDELGQLYEERLDAILPLDVNLPLTLPEGAVGQVVYDKNGYCAYPLLTMDFFNMSRTPLFETALALEQDDHEYEQALNLYRTGTMVSSIPYVVYDGTVAQIRCLRALKRYNEAMALCRWLAFPEGQPATLFTPNQIAQARLNYVELAVDANDLDVLASCLEAVMTASEVATETQSFVLQRMVELIQTTPLKTTLARDIEAARKLVLWNQVSVTASDQFLDADRFKTWYQGTLQACELSGHPVYALASESQDEYTVTWIPPDVIIQQVQTRLASLIDDKVFIRLTDREANEITPALEGATFYQASLTGHFQGWTLSLAFHPGIFPELARRQGQMYMWTVVLVAVLTVVLGLVVVVLLRREMQMTRLKNDFMATVTHELKTPLASTRLLVETLLDRNCDDPRQVTEYLALIDQENKRLGTLIDNFLTFSRMERNKQIFDKQPVSVETCVTAACDAMQARFQETACEFDCHVEQGLPKICVDQAAFVTVLVNLLENALKYTGDQKVISLKVTRKQDTICFVVKDNGIGMTPRQTRKVFDRFYQGDTSLSRAVQGCGLGLAIVKYIVKAHGGTVHVESEVGKGSQFVVELYGNTIDH